MRYINKQIHLKVLSRGKIKVRNTDKLCDIVVCYIGRLYINEEKNTQREFHVAN